MSGTKLLPAAVIFSDQPGLSNRLITILNALGSIRFDTIFCDPFSATEFPKVTS
jgi:hypothetical protein